MTFAAQRFLANDRNLLRTATLTASSVLPVENHVQRVPFARRGTAQALLTGAYSGAEEATYEIEILDTTVETPLNSAPVFNGVGAGGTLTEIECERDPQTFTLECREAGVAAAAASVIIEGVQVSARSTGTAGNSIRITVDQSDLVFTPSQYSLLADLVLGAGSDATPMVGQAFDWDAKVQDADGLIPADAHRVAFGADRSNIHLAYKSFVAGQWQYYLVPALTRDVPRGTQIMIVTGGRSVAVTNGVDTELYPETGPGDVVTAYDLLNGFKTRSLLLTVDGVVANDRSPTGQAARELSLRTDAHAQVSYGSGSKYATGLEDITVDPDAPTELIVFTCYAATPQDNVGAGLGKEKWTVKGSLSGFLGTAITGVPFKDPSESPPKFVATIPIKLPDGYGLQRGRISVTGKSFADRTATEPLPSICVERATLGAEAVDETITFTYRKRPVGSVCDCKGMPAPSLSAVCLGTGTGTTGGTDVIYSADALTRVQALYAYAKDLAAAFTSYPTGVKFTGIPANAVAADTTTFTDNGADRDGVTRASTLVATGGDIPIDNTTVDAAFADYNLPVDWRALLDTYDTTLQLIDALDAGAAKTAGLDSWDDALDELIADVPIAGISGLFRLESVATAKYELWLGHALTLAGISPLGKSDASSQLVSADGCWRDWGDKFWWEVVVSNSGIGTKSYMPAFTGKPWHSCRLDEDGYIRSTRELGLVINDKCPKEGDSVTVAISGAGWGPAYQVDDQLFLPTVAAAPQYLNGGRNAAPVQTWYPSGSIDGPLPLYLFDPTNQEAYEITGLTFLLGQGGIPYAAGDRWRFGIVGGHYRWRKNGGAWQTETPPAAIPLVDDTIEAGLAFSVITGGTNSFNAGDVYKFRALQPWAVSNLQSPRPAAWKWPPGTVTLVADLGSEQPITMAALVHSLPAGSTITLEGGTSPGVYLWSESITWRAGSLWQAMDRSARYVRYTFTNADGGAVQWAWLGVPLRQAHEAAFVPKRAYAMGRGNAGLITGATPLGKTVSADVTWGLTNWLEEAEAADLAAMLDWIKDHGDEPILVVMQSTRTTEAALFGRVNADEVDFPDVFDYRPDAGFARKHTLSLPIAGVMQ